MSIGAEKGAPWSSPHINEVMVCEDALIRSTDRTFNRVSFYGMELLVLCVTVIETRIIFSYSWNATSILAPP